MRAVVIALLGAWLTVLPCPGAMADSLPPPPPGPGTALVPPPGSGPISAPPRAPLPARVRLRQLERRAHYLKQQIWRLRMRRRQFLAQGMPYHAHHVHERMIAIGWRLRRVQAAERALMIH